MPLARTAQRGALVALLLMGCSDVRLDYPDEAVERAAVDNELRLSGRFCTSPAGNVDYPVKIMFVVDGSGSLQFSDQNRQRVVAVEDTLNALIGQPGMYFKIIVFNATVSATPANFGTPPPPVYSNNINDLLPALTDLAEADTLTDYQGALAVAFAEMQRDMLDVFSDPTRGQAELSRTKYVTIVISDGLPDPQCNVGSCNDTDPNFPADPACGGIQTNLLCEDQAYIQCLLQTGNTVCSGGICDNNGTLCFDQGPGAQNTLFGGLASTDLTAGQDYNQPYQILQKVQDIIDLQTQFEVGEIRVHAGLVLDPLADPAVIQIFGDPAQAAPLLEQVAETGDGVFLQFYGGDQIDFLQLNFESLRQPRVVRGFFAENRAMKVTATGPEPDSDFDGLSDAEEFATATDPRNRDSDGDGYSDLVEWSLRAFGYEPNNGCLPPIIDVPGVPAGTACDPATPFNCDFQFTAAGRTYFDRDLDDLHDCEELALGTNPNSPDTDRDGLPDEVDFRWGLDPLRWDSDQDGDQDGIPNAREIEWHLSPRVPQSQVDRSVRYRYARNENGATADGRTCFDFDVRHIQLAQTAEPVHLNQQYNPAQYDPGYNEVRLYVLENLADNLGGTPLIRTACVRPRYVPPSFKAPVSGEHLLCDRPPTGSCAPCAGAPWGVTAAGDLGDATVPVTSFKYLRTIDPLFTDTAIFPNPGDMDCELFDPTRDCVEIVNP